MTRISIVLTALCAALLSLSVDAATVYRCHTKHGLSYQDEPCHGRDISQDLVRTGEPSVVKSTRADNLGQWADQMAHDNRKRELQARAQRLRRENDVDTAEFAAMAVTSESQPKPVDELQQDDQKRQDYRRRIQRRETELQNVQSELNAAQ